MKKLVFFAFSIFILTNSEVFSQETLKGNKDITTINRKISGFNKIQILDDIDVVLIYNENQSVSIKTDSNIQDAIIAEVTNGILTLKTDGRTIRTKELTALINVNKNLKQIDAFNKATVKSNTLLVIDSLTINAFDNTEFNLKLNSKETQVNGKKTCDLSFEILSNIVSFNLEESTNLKASVNTKECFLNFRDRVSGALTGTTNNLEVETLGSATFKGKDFVSKNSTAKASNNSNIYINTTENLEVFANNASEIFIYNSPKIKLTEFNDKSTLYKREMDRSFF